MKKIKEEAMDTEKLDLIKEALSLSSFNHPNLIKFYGICVPGGNPKYIVLGNLFQFSKIKNLF